MSSIPLPPSPLLIGRPMNSGIDIYSDKIEYKTIQANTLVSYGQIEGLDKIVNTHLQQGWKLYGNMVISDNGGQGHSRYMTYYQVMIRKLPAKGGRRRSSVGTRKAKLKSNPPHKGH